MGRSPFFSHVTEKKKTLPSEGAPEGRKKKSRPKNETPGRPEREKEGPQLF